MTVNKEMGQRLRYLGGCVGVVSIYALVTLPIILSFPSVWPDEVNLYTPAAALARGQGMGTSVLAGFLPGIDRYTYWQPPGYFFFLSLVLRFVPIAHHFVAMRLFSWFLGVVVLLLGAAILKRLTPRMGWAWLGLVVLGTQVSFIQAANVGRMEMLSLVCTVAALNWYMAYRQNPRRRLLAGASFMAGLAMVCHPVGILAAFVMVVHELAVPQSKGSKAQDVLIFLGGILAAFVPWFAYIAQSPRLFSAQMLAQSTRKSFVLGTLLTSGGYESWIIHPFQTSIWPLETPLGGPWPFPHGSAVIIQFLVLGVGLVVLLAEGRHRIEASLLGAWALAGYGANLLLVEFWYAVHFTAPCCLLLGWAAAASSRRWTRALALATLALAATLNLNVAKLLWDINEDGARRYRLYCTTLEQSIPSHSTVLLAVLPDPYFGLVSAKKSYQFYEFVPEGVPVDHAQAEKAMGKIDYVIGSACCQPEYLVNYLLAHGRTEVDLGPRGFLAPPVFIWKISHRQEPSTKGPEILVPAR